MFGVSGKIAMAAGEALGAPYWLPTATYVTNVNIETQTSLNSGWDISDNGSYLYVYDGSADKVDQYTMSTPWDLSTLTYTKTSNLLHSSGHSHLHFNAGGTKYYVMHTSGSFPSNTITMQEVDLSIAYDVNSGSFGDTINLRAQMLDVSGITGSSFKPDGTEFYMFQNGVSNSPFTYTLSPAWEMSGSTYDAAQSDANKDNESYGFDWNADGTQSFTGSSSLIRAYNYTTGFDPSTQNGLDTPNQYDATSDLSMAFGIDGVRIKNAGKKMYVSYRESGTNDNMIAEYTLST